MDKSCSVKRGECNHSFGFEARQKQDFFRTGKAGSAHLTPLQIALATPQATTRSRRESDLVERKHACGRERSNLGLLADKRRACKRTRRMGGPRDSDCISLTESTDSTDMTIARRKLAFDALDDGGQAAVSEAASLDSVLRLRPDMSGWTRPNVETI
jgi:hypothetical protein